MVRQTTSNNASLNWSPHHEHEEGEREREREREGRDGTVGSLSIVEQSKELSSFQDHFLPVSAHTLSQTRNHWQLPPHQTLTKLQRNIQTMLQYRCPTSMGSACAVISYSRVYTSMLFGTDLRI